MNKDYQNLPTPKILRMKQIRGQTGVPPSTIYDRAKRGLFSLALLFISTISIFTAQEQTMTATSQFDFSVRTKEMTINLDGKRVESLHQKCQAN